MLNKNYLFCIIVFVIFSFSAIYGIVTRLSFNDNTHVGSILKNTDHISVSLKENNDYSSLYFNNNINDLENLINESDLIIKATVDTDRKNFNKSVLSKICIKDIYSISNFKRGDYIYVYEPSNFIVGNVNFSCFNGYTLMQPDYEYILFLKHLKTPPHYQYKSNEQISFTLVSSIYGKYKLSNSNDFKVANPSSRNGQLFYKDVENLDLLSSSAEIIEKYGSLKLQVLDRFEGNIMKVGK